MAANNLLRWCFFGTISSLAEVKVLAAPSTGLVIRTRSDDQPTVISWNPVVPRPLGSCTVRPHFSVVNALDECLQAMS